MPWVLRIPRIILPNRLGILPDAVLEKGDPYEVYADNHHNHGCDGP